MRVIKKYPAAFVMLIGWELIGLSGLLAVWEKAWQEWYMAMVGLMFILGAAVFASGVIFAIIRAVVRAKRKRNGARVHISDHEDDLAAEYMMRSRFNAFYWIVVIILSPMTPIVLVHILDVFMAGVLVMTLGIMIWMIIINKDVLLKRFYKVHNADENFSYESAEDSAILDSLYGDYIHVYRAEDWDEKERRFICSMLKRESKLGKTIKCYTVSNDFLSKKNGYEYHSHFDDLIMIPFGQFDINEKNGMLLKNYFDRLSIVRYTDLVNFKYQSKDSLDIADYAYTDESDSLRPFASGIESIGSVDGSVHIALGNACDADNRWKRYYNCMLVLENTELISGADIELNDNSHIEEYNIIADEKVIEMVVITAPNDETETFESDEEYFDSMRKTLRCKYEKLQWYWDGFCDMSKTEEIFSRISSDAAKQA